MPTAKLQLAAQIVRVEIEGKIRMISWHACIGIVGTILIVGSYLLIQIGKMKTTQISYSLSNAIGALLLIVSLAYEFNLGAMIVECFWLVISVIGILKFLQSPNQAATNASD